MQSRAAVQSADFVGTLFTSCIPVALSGSIGCFQVQFAFGVSVGHTQFKPSESAGLIG